MAERGIRRRRLEQAEGFAFDAILIAVAVAVSEDVVQDWLFANPRALYNGLAVLHLIAMPALLIATVLGYGNADREINRPGSSLLVWASVFLFGGSFIIPGVLALIFGIELWVMMTTILGPLVVFGLWMYAIVIAEKRGWIDAREQVPKRWWKVQSLALLGWAYLLWLETMLLVAAGKEGPLSRVGIPLGVLIDYLPIRVVLYYVRDSSRWERLTIVLAVCHLLYRIAVA